jgi:hypothetical protein
MHLKRRVGLLGLVLTPVLVLSLGLHIPVTNAAAMTNGWHEPVPLNKPAAAWMATSCAGASNYRPNLYHTGRDYWVDVGTPVVATGNGTVIGNEDFGNGFARALFVRHSAADGTQFTVLYGHVNTSLMPGAHVLAGDQVGTIAQLTVGSHLHLGLYPGTDYPSSGWGTQPCSNWPSTNGFVDPIPYLDAHPAPGGTGVIGIPPPGLGSKIAAARHADGRLAVFYIGANGAIYYRNQNSPGSTGWTPEVHIPAYAKAIAAVTNAQGRIELFYIGGNNGLYHRWQPWTNTDQWSPEEYFSANIRAVAAANNGNGILAVAAVGADNQLYIMQQPAPNSWNGQWHNVPAQSVDIAMATSHDGRNELFHVGTTYDVYHRWEWSPGCCWSSPEEMWDTNLRKLAVARNADGRMEVFAIGSNAQIYSNWQQRAGANWANTWLLLPAQARYIAAATNVDGKLEIFYVGANNSVYHRRQTQAGCCWGPEDVLPANVAP